MPKCITKQESDAKQINDNNRLRSYTPIASNSIKTNITNNVDMSLQTSK